jgi:hypothetical protein
MTEAAATGRVTESQSSQSSLLTTGTAVENDRMATRALDTTDRTSMLPGRGTVLRERNHIQFNNCSEYGGGMKSAESAPWHRTAGLATASVSVGSLE